MEQQLAVIDVDRVAPGVVAKLGEIARPRMRTIDEAIRNPVTLHLLCEIERAHSDNVKVFAVKLREYVEGRSAWKVAVAEHRASSSLYRAFHSEPVQPKVPEATHYHLATLGALAEAFPGPAGYFPSIDAQTRRVLGDLVRIGAIREIAQTLNNRSVILGYALTPSCRAKLLDAISSPAAILQNSGSTVG